MRTTNTLTALLVGSAAFFALAIAGCASTADDLAAHLADRSLSRRHLIEILDGDLSRYQACLHERGGSCPADRTTPLPGTAGMPPAGGAAGGADGVGPSPALQSSLDRLPAGHPAKIAGRVLAHPVMGQVVGLHAVLAGRSDEADGAGLAVDTDPDGRQVVHMSLSLAAAEDWTDQVNRAASFGGWSALREQAAQQMAEAPARSPAHHALARDNRRALFVEHYVAAYFRNGRFVEVDFTIPAEQAQADISRELAAHAKDACRLYGAASGSEPSSSGSGGEAACDALAGKLYAEVRGSSGSVDKTLVKVSQTGYVSRDGSYTARFPEFAIDVDPLATHLLTLSDGTGTTAQRVDFTRIGSDLVRITLEALFDAHQGLPAVPRATGRQLGADSLPLFAGSLGEVTADDFGEMARIDQSSAVATGVTLARVIRGLGPFSLNNEALEELIVTAITTSVRAAVAEATWCWYACGLDLQVHEAAADVKTEAKAAREEGEEIAGRVEGRVRGELHRVALDLRLTP